VHAAVLARLQEIDPDLAAAIHDGDGPKPLTCSGLLAAPASGMLVPGQVYAVRFTALTPEVAAGLRAAVLQTQPPYLELDGQRFAVEAAICDAVGDAWTGADDYVPLAAQYLGPSATLPRTVTLEFASPTTFRSAGNNVPIPLPSLVFGSLVERWNAFSPVALSPDARRFGAEMVAISRYRLHSVAVAHKGDALRIGGVGQVSYRVLSHDRYWLGTMHLLAAFALYSGVGSQTAAGMGQCRALARTP
jgi:CRISPR-associated endoribonuclease Cas6